MTGARNRTIILADPDEGFRKLVEEAFADEPYRLVLTGSSRDTMEAVERNQPDLVLLDTGPGVDGFAVCRDLKAREATRLVPVVLVCSGSEKEEEIVRGFREGADDLIRKPLSVAYLKTKIRIWMARSGRS